MYIYRIHVYKCTKYISLLLRREVGWLSEDACFPFPTIFFALKLRSKSQESHPPAANLRGDHWIFGAFTKQKLEQQLAPRRPWMLPGEVCHGLYRRPFGGWNLTVEWCSVSSLEWQFQITHLWLIYIYLMYLHLGLQWIIYNVHTSCILHVIWCHMIGHHLLCRWNLVGNVPFGKLLQMLLGCPKRIGQLLSPWPWFLQHFQSESIGPHGFDWIFLDWRVP